MKAAYGVRLHDVEEAAMSELGSPKRQREQLVRSLRAKGRSWVEVAEVVRQRYRVNARVAFRYAHGWSQRWPDAEDVQELLVLGDVAEEHWACPLL